MAITNTSPPVPGQANAIAIAIKWYLIQAGSVSPDSPGFLPALTANVIQEIAQVEHKSPHDIDVVARGRVAAATVYAARAGRDTAPGAGDIGNVIGGTVSTGVGAVKDVVMAPITIAEFLAKLANPFLWVRVAEVVGGGILIVVGVRMLAREGGIDIPTPRLPMMKGG